MLLDRCAGGDLPDGQTLAPASGTGGGHPGPSGSIEVLDRWAVDDRMEVGFLLYPRLSHSRGDFDGFVARLQTAASRRYPLGQAPFALAAFHPDARPDLHNAERLA